MGAVWSSSAHAQPGEGDGASEALDATPSPSDGFPDADTALARPSAWLTRVPTLTLYYGIDDDPSIGTHRFAFLPLGALEPAGSSFTRHRLGSTSWFRSTVDVALARIDGGGTNDPLGVAWVGSSTEFTLARGHRLTLDGGHGHVDGALGDVDMAAGGAMLGATYSFVLARWAALHATASYVTSGRASIGGDSAGSFAVDLNGAASAADRVVLRGAASVRAGSWQFDAGALRLGSSVMPWVGISFEVGG